MSIPLYTYIFRSPIRRTMKTVVESSSQSEQKIEDDVKSDLQNRWGHVEDWLVAGNGKVTNPNKNDPKACGKFYGIKGCLNVKGHNKTTLDGVNHKGMMYGRKQFRYCFNPRCPTCHDHGWGRRQIRTQLGHSLRTWPFLSRSAGRWRLSRFISQMYSSGLHCSLGWKRDEIRLPLSCLRFWYHWWSD